MRALFLAGALSAVTALAPQTSAGAGEPLNAREAYVERRGLIEADARCNLLAPNIRAALQVSAAQTRGTLLRAGWTNAGVQGLEHAVATAAHARPCNDPRTLSSAADARAAFASWVNAGSMRFPGWERAWVARRARGEGWRLSQSIDGAGVFGVRERAGQQRLQFVAALRGSAAPTSVRLIIRDRTRWAPADIALPQRVAQGLAAGAPAPGSAQTVNSTRTIEDAGGQSQVVFTFPDTAFRDLLALDPRESVELRLENSRAAQRLYIEVGDVAAARSFLTIR